MTLTTTTNKASYSGNGNTTTFAYAFKILANSDLKVYIRSANGTETLKTITTHYTVTGVGSASGGNVVFTVGNIPTNTETVVIQRVVPLTQTHDYVENDPFPAESHEQGLDRLTMHVQQLQEEVDRSIKASVSNTISSTEFTNDATDRANKLFAFDSAGNINIATTIGSNTGNWASGTAYSERDIVKDTSTNNIFQCKTAHTSSGSQPLTNNTDSAKWDLLVDASSATTSATNASNSATASANSATASANSATASATSETNASNSESAVATNATNASNSATASATSATASASSATASATSETNAGTSETNAGTSATNASNSATASANSATASANSATASASSASTASGHKDTATTKASEASTSATNASNSATTATTQATNSSNSATASANSATASANSATASASSATSSATTLTNFEKQYLGAKSSAPTADNDGTTLDASYEGTLYFNSTDDKLYVWSGSAWTLASFTAGGFLSASNNLSDVANAGTARTNLGVLSTSNNLSDLANAGTARTNLGLGSVSTLTAGTSASNAVQLDGNAKLPAVDGSALTNLPASGGIATLVADGAITAGKPAILTGAGKAKQIAETGNNIAEGFATENQFNGSDAINYGSPNLAIIGTNKVAVSYRDSGNNNYAVGRVAEVSANGDLTFGTAVVLNSAESTANVVGYNSSNSTVAFGYTNASNNAWYVKAGTISGTTLSLSSEGTIETSITITQWSGMVDPDTGHFVIFHTGGGQVYATAVTISGTNTPSKAYGQNITGTTTFTNSGNSFGMGMDYDTNINRFLLTPGKDEPVDAVKFWVVANSGSAFTITEVSKAVTNWKGKSNVVFDPDNNKMILSYNNTSTQFSMAQLTMASADFTIDHYIHTSISNDGGQYTSYCTDADTIATFIGYGGNGGAGDNASFATFTNDGSAFTQVSNGTWDTQAFFVQRGGIAKKSFASLASNPIPIIMSDAGNSGYARSFSVGQSPVTNLDNNYLGLAKSTVSDGQNVDINLPVGSINSSQSSLSIGEDYFTDNAGTVRTFVSGGNALSGGKYLGKALSATSIELKETPTDIIFGKAGGNITKGKPIIVEDDGDFAQVAGTTTSGSEATTSYMEVHTTTGDVFGIASDGAGTMCVVFRGTSNYIQVSKGTLNADNTITWATPVTMDSVYGNSCSVYYDKTNSFFVANFQSYNDWYAYRVTGSGNTTTVANARGSSYGVGSGVTQQVAIYSESESCGVTLLGKQTSKLGTLTSAQAEASGNGYSAISGLVGGSAQDVQFLGMDYDQSRDVGVCWWRAEANSDYPTVRAYTVSGTGNGSVTMGTAVVLETNGTNAYGGIAIKPGNEGLCVWKDSGTELRQCSFTFSGTAITGGTAGAVARVGSEEYYVEGTQVLTYNPKSDRYYFAYNNSADNYDVMLKEFQYSSGTVSVTNTIKVFDASSNNNYYWNIKYVGNTTVGRETQQSYMLMLGKEHGDDAGTFGYLPAFTDSTTNLTTENFIGFADTASSANGTSKVRIVGLDANQSSLTPAQRYFVQTDGSLGLTEVSGTSVNAGQAISSTQINIKG